MIKFVLLLYNLSPQMLSLYHFWLRTLTLQPSCNASLRRVCSYIPEHRTLHTLKQLAIIAKRNITCLKTLEKPALLFRGISATTNAIAIDILETIVTITIANETASARAIGISSNRIIPLFLLCLFATTNHKPTQTTKAVTLKI